MLDRRMMCFLTIFQIVSGNGESFRRNSFLKKLVNRTVAKYGEYAAVVGSQGGTGCSYGCITPNGLLTDFPGQTQPRFIDGDANDTEENDDLEPPSGKFSIFNLMSDDEEREKEDDDDDSDEKAKKDEGEDEHDEENDIDFFGSEEEISSNKLEGTKGESFLKQYHRQNLRLHSFVFPLLMAYKLKFFTVIPLLLGALVLLVGTTGIAGFFFALFAAALGIHVKSQNH